MQVAVRIYWTEYERGWGSRPDGTTLHKDMETAKRYVKDYWTKQPKGTVPDEYSAPGDPVIVEVTDEQYARVQSEGSYWVSIASHI